MYFVYFWNTNLKLVLILLIGEAGWTPDQWGHSRFKMINASADTASNQKSLTAFMRLLLKASLRFSQSSSLLYILIKGTWTKKFSTAKSI